MRGPILAVCRAHMLDFRALPDLEAFRLMRIATR
jgi:hypothetical protein